MRKFVFGILAFFSILSWSSCEVDEPVVELTEFYFTANIDGDSLTVIDEGNLPARLGFYSDKDSIGIDGVDCAVSYQAQFRDIGNLNQEAVFFTFNRYYEGLCSREPEDFRTLFLPEVQAAATRDGVKGWIFQYRDPSGNVWSSLNTNQSTSRLEILTSESIADDEIYGFKRQKITGTLSCSLGNPSLPSKTINNGKFSIYITSYDW